MKIGIIISIIIVAIASIIIYTKLKPSNQSAKANNDTTITDDSTAIGQDTTTKDIGNNNTNLSEKLILKDNLIKEKLLSKGYSYSVLRISSFRNAKENALLPLSAKNSFHLEGKAIDVIVGDINNDFKANLQDVDLFISIIKEVEKENPQLVGGIGTYKSKWYAKLMVHFDTRGYAAYWNY